MLTSATKYVGIIDVEDFNTSKPYAKRISNQAKADKYYFNKEINMTLEELREQKLITNSNGRPSSTMTDAKWQKEFEIRKAITKPYPSNVNNLAENSVERELFPPGETYDGDTNWQNFAWFINDVLCTIRKPTHDHDYCYYINQIDELLKFHPNNLVAKYREDYGCWEVWLKEA